MQTMWNIAAIGECMLELSNPGGKPLTRNMALRFSFGGDTLNTAIYLSRLGVSCSYVTALGDDPFSDWLLREWQQEGVDISLVKLRRHRQPGLYMIQTDAGGERSFFYWRKDSPARELFADPAEARGIFGRLQGFDVLYLSGITLSLYDAVSLENLFGGLEDYRAGGGCIVFDGNFRPAGWSSDQTARDIYRRVYRLTGIAMPTFDDEARLFNDASPEHTLERLRESGVGEVAVKHGAKGVLVGDLQGCQWVAANPVDRVVDSTAAGDSFNGGYLAARARGMSPRQAAVAGNRLAGSVIQQPGAIISVDKMPDLGLQGDDGDG